MTTTICGNCGKPKKQKTTIAEVVSNVNALVATVNALRPKRTVAQEVEAELEKHPGVAALINERTGVVETFAVPVPYFAQHTASGASSSELEQQKAALVAQLPGADDTVRAKLDHEISVLEREIKVARANEESQRRNNERQVERKKQRYGSER
jgi:hypothetical protein